MSGRCEDGGVCVNAKRFRWVAGICIASLCLNAFFVIRDESRRSTNYREMSMVPYYLSMALASYKAQFSHDPNVHYVPGSFSVNMAFSAYQASESLYEDYGYHDSEVYGFLYNLTVSSSDATAYHDLLGIASYLPNTYIKSSQIQPLFNAMAREMKENQSSGR